MRSKQFLQVNHSFQVLGYVLPISFCRRLRSIKPEDQDYQVNLDSLQVNEHSLEAELLNNKATEAKFKLILTALESDTFRVFIDEVNPLFPRYVVHESLAGEPQIAG